MVSFVNTTTSLSVTSTSAAPAPPTTPFISYSTNSLGTSAHLYNTWPAGLVPSGNCSILLDPALATWTDGPSSPVVGTYYITVDQSRNTTITSRTCVQSIATGALLDRDFGGTYGAGCSDDGDFIAYWIAPGGRSYSWANSIFPANTTAKQFNGPSTIFDLGNQIAMKWSSAGLPGTFFESSISNQPYYYTGAYSISGRLEAGVDSKIFMPDLPRYFPGIPIDKCETIHFGTSPNVLTRGNFLTERTTISTTPAGPISQVIPTPVPTVVPGDTPVPPPGPSETGRPDPVPFPPDMPTLPRDPADPAETSPPAAPNQPGAPDPSISFSYPLSTPGAPLTEISEGTLEPPSTSRIIRSSRGPELGSTDDDFDTPTPEPSPRTPQPTQPGRANQPAPTGDGQGNGPAQPIVTRPSVPSPGQSPAQPGQPADQDGSTASPSTLVPAVIVTPAPGSSPVTIAPNAGPGGATFTIPNVNPTINAGQPLVVSIPASNPSVAVAGSTTVPITALPGVLATAVPGLTAQATSIFIANPASPLPTDIAGLAALLNIPSAPSISAGQVITLAPGTTITAPAAIPTITAGQVLTLAPGVTITAPPNLPTDVTPGQAITLGPGIVITASPRSPALAPGQTVVLGPGTTLNIPSAIATATPGQRITLAPGVVITAPVGLPADGRPTDAAQSAAVQSLGDAILSGLGGPSRTSGNGAVGTRVAGGGRGRNGTVPFSGDAGRVMEHGIVGWMVGAALGMMMVLG